VEVRFALERGWRDVFSPWRKKEGIGKRWRWFHPLYDYFFGIEEGIEKLLKLLLQ
jgi:hypothetical protein